MTLDVESAGMAAGIHGTMGVEWDQGTGDELWQTVLISVSGAKGLSRSRMHKAEEGKIHAILQWTCLWPQKNCEAKNYKNNEREEKDSIGVE